jgi:Na+/melibiose symporter-like transporter
MRATWRILAGRRDLRLVLSAGIISLTGDWILTIGLIYRVYAVTGSTVASALTMASSFAPQVLLGAVAGVFADRWDRKRTMIAADLLLAAGLLPLLLVHDAAQVWIVFAVMFWEGSVQQFFSPAEQAMVPRLVPDDELMAANAVSGQVSNVSRLAGSALGGILAAAGGIIAVTLIDAVSFLASALLLALVRTTGRTAASPEGGSIRVRLARVGAELRDGLQMSARHRVLRALMIFALVTSVGEGAMSTLFTPFVERVLHGSPQDLGLIMAAQAIGGIAGGMVAAASGHRFRAGRMMCYGAVVFGLVDLAIFLYPLGYVAVWPAVAGMIIVGLPGALTLAGLITLFQRSSDDAYRGRVFGAVSALEGVTVLAGTLGSGYLSRLAGIIPVLAVQGGGYVVAGLAMLVWLKEEPGAPPAPMPSARAGPRSSRRKASLATGEAQSCTARAAWATEKG